MPHDSPCVADLKTYTRKKHHLMIFMLYWEDGLFIRYIIRPNQVLLINNLIYTEKLPENTPNIAPTVKNNINQILTQKNVKSSRFRLHIK